MSHTSPSLQPQTKKREIIPQYIHDLKAELMAHTDTSIASLASMILKNMATKEDLAETNAELRAFKIETNNNFAKVNAEIKHIKSVMATKDDLKNFAKKSDLKNFVKKTDLKNFATKDDLKNFATKDDLKNFATKDDIKNFATKDDSKNFATKDDLKNFAIEYDLKNVATKKDLIDHMQVFTKLWQSGDVRITRLEKEVFDVGR